MSEKVAHIPDEVRSGMMETGEISSTPGAEIFKSNEEFIADLESAVDSGLISIHQVDTLQKIGAPRTIKMFVDVPESMVTLRPKNGVKVCVEEEPIVYNNVT